MKNNFKKLGFTLSEAIIVIAIIGLIATLCVAGLRFFNPTEKNWRTLSEKMAVNFEDATTQIFVNNAVLDDFTNLVDGKDHFSIEDSDATPKMANLYRKYLSDIVMNVDMTNEYFSKDLLDYDKTSLGINLKDTYSEFFYVNDGMLMGLRFYSSCNASEMNANPPEHRGKFQVDGICGSVFYDVNAFQKPNKLGSDQFIIPIYKRGVKYTSDN